MTIQGKSVYSGVAIGRLAIYRKSENQVKREKSQIPQRGKTV